MFMNKNNPYLHQFYLGNEISMDPPNELPLSNTDYKDPNT